MAFSPCRIQKRSVRGFLGNKKLQQPTKLSWGTPSSQPLMTCPTPIYMRSERRQRIICKQRLEARTRTLVWKGAPRSLELSNLFPLRRVPT
jgi:hypothetical protein